MGDSTTIAGVICIMSFTDYMYLNDFVIFQEYFRFHCEFHTVFPLCKFDGSEVFFTPHVSAVSVCRCYAGVSLSKRVDFIAAVMSSQQHYRRHHQHHVHAHTHTNTNSTMRGKKMLPLLKMMHWLVAVDESSPMLELYVSWVDFF